MNLHHWFTTPPRDLHEVIYTFLWDLHDSRFTTFQKGKDSICNFWEDEVHIDLQQNSHFVFQNLWKRFEATLHLLIILEKVSWKVSGKKFYFRKNYASNKARKLKVLSNFVPVLLCIIDDFSFKERLNSKCFLSFQQNSIYRCNIASFSRLFKEVFKDQFQAQIGNNAFKKLDCRAYTCPSSTNSKVSLCIIVSALDHLRRWGTTDVFNLFA